MASGHLKGTAKFVYTPDGGGSPVTHLLAVPLLDVRPVRQRRRFQWWSMDWTSRSIVNVGNPQSDIAATIRCENQPDDLTGMLREALEYDVVLSYFREESAAEVDCKVVAIVGAAEGEIPLDPDPDRFGFGEYMVRVQLRAVNGDNWSGIL